MSEFEFVMDCKRDLVFYAEFIQVQIDNSMVRYGRITENMLRSIEPTFSRAIQTTIELRDSE